MAVRNTYAVDEAIKRSFDWGLLRKTARYIWHEKVLFLQALCMQTLAILIGLFGPVCSAKALDEAVPAKDTTSFLLYCGAMLLCIVCNVLFTTLSSRRLAIIGQNIILRLRSDLFVHLQKLSFSYYDTRPHGKILVRVIQNVNSVSDMLSNGLLNLLLQTFNLVFITVFMFAMNPTLSWVILAGLPFALGFILLVKPLQRKGWQNYSTKNSNINAYLNESILCMKIAQLFVREKRNGEIYENLLKDAKKAWYWAAFPSNSVAPYMDFISRGVSAIVVFVGLFVLSPAVSIGVLLAMMQYCANFWQPINQLANIYNSFINNVAYLERIFETLDEPVEVQDAPGASQLPQIAGNVRFEHVNFAYEEGHPVLRDVNLDIQAGQSIALVGHTGSGKTTIINLLSRFYNCTEGRVLIDGHDIAKATLVSLRAQMGIMLQDSFLFSGTVMENLRYGNLDATDDELIAAAKLVCADQVIENLPQGYETVLTEGGASLSQGEKQLFALARTIAADPRILVLDEATSSIDTGTELLLQQGIQQMMKGRTSFVVAHRLSTIRSCDRIFYVHHGEIAEQGTHDELLAQKGLYWELCRELTGE